MQQIKKKLASLKDEVDEANAKAEACQGRVKELTDANEKLQQEVDSYTRKMNLLENELEVTEDRLAEARRKMLEVPPPSPRDNSRNDEVEEKLQDMIDDWKTRFQEMETKFEDKERECLSMKAHVQRLEGDLDATESKYANAKSELEQTLAELDDL